MKMKVMVADDDSSVRESLRKVIRSAGYEVVAAADVREAAELFEQEDIDLLVLDIGLLIRSGWETIEHITSRSPELPTIIVTGQADQCDMSLKAGVGAIMEKPLDALKLLQAMRELLVQSDEARMSGLRGWSDDVRYIRFGGAVFLRKLREPRLLRFRSALSHSLQSGATWSWH